MKIFFAGNYFGDGGPQIVNKNLVFCLRHHISYLIYKNRYLRFIEAIYKIIGSKTIVFSGVTNVDNILVPICLLFKRKIIYIMHGCLELEYKTNNYTFNPTGLKNEKLLLLKSDLILCVSNTFKEFIASFYPQYTSKMDVLVNGVNWRHLEETVKNNRYLTRDNYQILLMGGGRRTKRNLQICQAIQKINEENRVYYKVIVYGNLNNSDDSKEISNIPCVTFHSLISHDAILMELRKSRLFIQNSDFESFSLGAIEALCCGCDLLISKNVGAKDIIGGLMDEDIIFENTNINHIQQKVLHVLKRGNNLRLLNSIHKEKTSIRAAADRLLSIANSF